MWVGGKRYRGEAVDAVEGTGRLTRTSSAGSRTPACSNRSAATSRKMRIYPVPRRGKQRIEIKFTAILPLEEVT